MGELSDLEKAADNKKRIVEDVFHRYLGISIRELHDDITNRLGDPTIDMIPFEKRDYKEAKSVFLKHFLVRLLNRHRGNVKSASDEARSSRRTLHRMIKNLSIDLSSIRRETSYPEYENKIYDTVEKSLKQYEDVLHPKKIDDIYSNMDSISKDIAKGTIDSAKLSMREASDIFDYFFLADKIREAKGNLSRTSKEIGLSYETLYRKLRRLKTKGFKGIEKMSHA